MSDFVKMINQLTPEKACAAPRPPMTVQAVHIYPAILRQGRLTLSNHEDCSWSHTGGLHCHTCSGSKYPHLSTLSATFSIDFYCSFSLPTHLFQIKFPEQKVKLGRAKCTCDFTILPEEPCTGKAKCDKKCSGKGTVALDGFEIDVKCSKGKCAVSNCKGSEPPVGSQAPTGSGSGSEPLPITGSGPEPLPTTGSGSGPEPLPPTGSGSGPVPLPIIGSGSGPVPLPNTGEGMPCSCKCSCPDGGSDCECACNCPVTSQHISCGTGFTKVCPMMKDMMCPDMMVAVCPISMMQTRAVQNRMSHEGEGRCQCVPDFLLAMVPGMPEPGTVAAGRVSAACMSKTGLTSDNI